MLQCSWLLVFTPKHPATYTLTCRLARLRNQNVAGVPTRRSLARSPPAATGMAAISATIFRCSLQLCSSTCRIPPHGRTRTPHRHKTPPVGVQSQGTIARSSHAQSRHKAGTQFRREKNYNHVQAGTTFIPNRLQLI